MSRKGLKRGRREDQEEGFGILWIERVRDWGIKRERGERIGFGRREGILLDGTALWTKTKWINTPASN